MNVIYYYYFLFYTKILKEDEPYATTVFALSVSQGFVVNVIINLIIINKFCISLNEWIMIMFQLIILLLNYLYFNKSKLARKIIKQKPMFFGHNLLSIIITILFFIVTLSFMFWGPIYSKYLLRTHCN